MKTWLSLFSLSLLVVIPNYDLMQTYQKKTAAQHLLPSGPAAVRADSVFVCFCVCLFDQDTFFKQRK